MDAGVVHRSRGDGEGSGTMEGQEVEIRLRVRIPSGSDISTVDRLVYEAGRRAMAEAFEEAASDESEPGNCSGCGKKGR